METRVNKQILFLSSYVLINQFLMLPCYISNNEYIIVLIIVGLESVASLLFQILHVLIVY